jgi:hypothetical protein
VSQGNPELARQGYEVLNRGEIDRFLTEFVHPDYEFHTGVRVPSIPSVVRGRDGLRAWIQQWYEEPWEGQLHTDVERIEELDNGRVLALLTRRTWGSLGPLLLAQPGGQGLLPGGEAVDPKAEPLAEREDVGVLGVDRDAAPAALGAQRWAAQRSAHEASEAPASASPSIGPGATGGRAASQAKLRELQRASDGAAARLRRAEAGAPPPRPPA